MIYGPRGGGVYTVGFYRGPKQSTGYLLCLPQLLVTRFPNFPPISSQNGSHVYLSRLQEGKNKNLIVCHFEKNHMCRYFKLHTCLNTFVVLVLCLGKIVEFLERVRVREMSVGQGWGLRTLGD